MWRHKLDMVAALATESALAALSDTLKTLQRASSTDAALAGSGLAYISDMLRIAGFVAPVVFIKEIQSALTVAELQPATTKVLIQALEVLAVYLRTALQLGVQPSLFFYRESLLLSDLTARNPPPCGSFFAPVLFWEANEGLSQSDWRVLSTYSRPHYQAALLAFLRHQERSGLADFARQMCELTQRNQLSANITSYHVCAAFLSVVSSKTEAINQEEMHLFSMLDSVFFKPASQGIKPEPILISRLLHVIAKSRAGLAVVNEMQNGLKLDGLLYGAAPDPLALAA